MEGFLFKKGRGQSGFLGRKNWKKRWCVLEGQFLTYYEDFDQKAQKPTEKKGMVPVRGCTVEEVNNKEKKFQFVLKHETRSPLYMSADDAKMMATWIKALDRAAKTLHDGPVSIDFTEYYNIFGLKMSDNPTTSQINRAYRKTCLKCHPDKGGDPNEFKKVQEAYEILLSKLEEEEEEKLYKTVHYDAVIEKGPPGTGFGMVVVEDQKKQVIYVKKVLEKMNLKSITEESKGSVAEGDILVQIGDDDIAGWTLTRIVQRLNDFRVPVNSDIQLRFSRRVKIVEDEEPEEGGGGGFADIDEDPPATTGNSGDASEQQSPPPVYTPGPYGDMHDIDEETYVPPPGQQNGQNSSNPPNTSSADIDESEHAENQDRTKPSADDDADDFVEEEQEFHAAEGDWEDVMKDPARRATIDSAGDELRAEFEELSNTLKDVISQRDDLKAQVDGLKEIIRSQKAEKKSLLKQLELADQDCEGAEQREADAVLQLKEISYQSQQSKEEEAQLTRDAAQVTSLLKRSKDIPVSRDFEIFLDRHGYSENKITTTAHSAQRTALRAAACLDKSGAVLRKWSLEGDSVVGKLKKFEKKLDKQQEEEMRRQRSLDRHGMGGVNAAEFRGFDAISAQINMPPPNDIGEDLFNNNQDLDKVNYDDAMYRAPREHEVSAPPVPRRAPPSRPAPRVDENRYGGNNRDDTTERFYQPPDPHHGQYQPSLEDLAQSPAPKTRRFAPNPLIANANTGTSGSSGGKIMGLLERKLSNRTAGQIASPGPQPLRRAAPRPPQQLGVPSSVVQQPLNGAHIHHGQFQAEPDSSFNKASYPTTFHDDYSDGSESFGGWKGMAH